MLLFEEILENKCKWPLNPVYVPIYFSYYFWVICKWQLVHFEVVCESLLTSFRVKIYKWEFAFLMPSHANLTTFDYMANPKTNNSLYAHKQTHTDTNTDTRTCVWRSVKSCRKKSYINWQVSIIKSICNIMNILLNVSVSLSLTRTHTHTETDNHNT